MTEREMNAEAFEILNRKGWIPEGMTCEEYWAEQERKRANRPHKGDEPPELTPEDEAILGRAWASLP